VHTHGQHGPEPGQYSSYEAKQLPLILFDFQDTLITRRPSRREHVFVYMILLLNKTTIKSKNSLNFSRIPLEKEVGGKQ
jgi:hypothetical protein